MVQRMPESTFFPESDPFLPKHGILFPCGFCIGCAGAGTSVCCLRTARRMVAEPGFAAALTAAQLVELGWALVVLGGGQAVGGWTAPPHPGP